MQRSRR